MSAQEIIPIETPTGGTPVSVPEPAAGAALPAAPAPAATSPESRRDFIARQVKNPPVRGADGKFIPSSPIAAAPAAQFPTPDTIAPQRPAMPKSYKKELELHWNTLPHEFAASVVQRESDYEKGVAPLKEKARIADEVLKEFKPYEQMLQTEGGTPAAAIRQLLSTAAIFRSNNPGLKAQAVVQIMRQFGIPLEHLQQVQAGTPPPQPGVDPQQITQLVEQRLAAFQRQQSDTQNQTEIERFAANPEHEHFDAVSDWMANLMTTERFRADHVGKSPQEKLKSAYETAIRMDPEIYQKVAAKQQAKDNAARQVHQSKNAAVQVKGAPSAGPAPTPNPNNRRELIAAQFRATR